MLPRVPLLLACALALSACSAGTPRPSTSVASGEVGPGGIIGLRTLTEDLPNDHEDGPLSYDEVPPLGGAHNPKWLRCEVYDAPVPAEFAVHSLEHGAVWLTHRPGVDVGPLRELAGSGTAAEEYVLVSPVPELDSPVLAVAWGVSLAVDSPTDRRLAQFVEAYAGGGQGGEQGAPCTSSPSALTPEQGRAALGEGGVSA